MHKVPQLTMLTAAALLLVPALALALVPVEEGSLQGGPAVIHTPELDARPSLVRYEMGNPEAAEKPGMRQFFEEHSSSWEIMWDQRSNRPNLISGRGIAFLPGAGNALTNQDVGLGPDGKPNLARLERMARIFVTVYPDLFGVDQEDLVLNEGASGNFGADHQLWFVEFQQTYQGIPVEGTSVFLRISHGNLVQFGTERVARIKMSLRTKYDQKQALEQVIAATGWHPRSIGEMINDGELKIIPMLPDGQTPGYAFEGATGTGYRHLLVWELVFRLKGDDATYKALVNAKTGKVLQVVDINRYATVQGGIYPETYTDTEVTRVLDYAQITGSTTNLDGTYVRINDNCGSISCADSDDGSTDGIIDMGTSGGDDCTTPGYGGAGNTHSARSGHYHMTQVNRIADVYHPTNSWVDSKLTANMNINNTCNAYWSGSTVNFYRSGGGCGNTGEIAAVFLHEWGHGLDANTGGGSDSGSGETVGDTIAFTYLRTPCIGKGFFSDGSTCYNCATCTGVRDAGDFSYHDGTATIAKPSTVTSDTGINCDRWSCPYWGYDGIMGYEGHCESYISTAAVWDLGVELRNTLGTEAGWDKLEQIWYDSMPASKEAYRITSGGTCNPSAAIDGCGSSNYYQVFLVADDDNGNLADGTPNACRIWDAFNYHDIACGARPVCSSCTITENPEVSCSDGVDNDCDGLIDTADPDCGCTVTENPEVSCSDGVDNDCDGYVDGDDPDCGCTVTENPEVSCSDGVDNDCDGYVDGNDTDCQSSCLPAWSWCTSSSECCSGFCFFIFCF